MWCMHECESLKPEESLELRVTGGCEPSNKSPGNRSPVLAGITTLNFFPAPHVLTQVMYPLE